MKITTAALQLALNGDVQENIAAVSDYIVMAADQGAKIILPPELFASHYFCNVEDENNFALAYPVSEHPSVKAMAKLAKQLGIAIPTSFFERDGVHYYNSMAMIDPNGDIIGIYRKSHIPDGPGYEEKFYFRPGNSGFKVWEICGIKIGVGICWDQWYPECARAMALMGADMLFFPTAIGSEPYDTELDTSRMWRRAMQGHAVANCMPIIASNRIGAEISVNGEQVFYGHSFITNEWGDLVTQYGADESGVLIAEFDLSQIRKHRAGMGFFRDRRPELYQRLTQDI